MKNTKTRKNNKPLVLVAMLLMIALVLGMGAMTYSKYVSSQQLPAKQATAAKWGYVVTVNADNLLGSAYESGEVTATVNAATNEVLATLDGGNRGLVVAPGTSGFMTITVSGSAEVRARLAIDVAAGYTEIHLADYYPVVWTLTNVSTSAVVASGKLSEVITSLETTQTLNPGVDTDINYKLSWAWDDYVDAATDVKDTALGLFADGKSVAEVNAALGTAYAADIQKETQLSLAITVSVEQVVVAA